MSQAALHSILLEQDIVSPLDLPGHKRKRLSAVLPQCNIELDPVIDAIETELNIEYSGDG